MIKNKTFRITFTKLNGEEITRFGTWTDKCKSGETLKGIPFITYYDLDQKGFRTATKHWEVRY